MLLPMSWVNLALVSAAILGAVNILDSHLIAKRMPSFQSFLLPIGALMLICGLVLFYLFPLPESTSVWILLPAIASGLLRTAAVTMMLYILKKEEVSRVVPVVYTSPIFVAIMAVPLLGESLHYLEWLAILVVVAGAIMISTRQSPSGTTTLKVKPLLLLFGSSLLFALSDITSKYVLAYISPWNLLWLNAFCLSGIFLVMSIRPHTIKQLRNLKQRKSAIVLLTLNETLAFAGIALSFLAMEKGPVSLVSTIAGSRPAFVVIFALILSHLSPAFLDWHPGRGGLTLRLIAIAMIIGGITTIHLI